MSQQKKIVGYPDQSVTRASTRAAMADIGFPKIAETTSLNTNTAILVYLLILLDLLPLGTISMLLSAT